MSISFAVRRELNQCWQDSRSLTAVALLMLVAFTASCGGLVLDKRILLGAPIWLKPVKFAISTSLYAGTLAYMLRYVRRWRRFAQALGFITAAVLVLEVAIIDLQAVRGTTSHFNVRTPLDSALWSTMGVAIGILWLSSLSIFIVLMRQRFSDSAFGWALRLGMLITVIGSSLGGLMVNPTEQQLAEMRRTHHAPAIIGSHTVGGLDGGSGLRVVGWSATHGDLRIPHFLGLHALQLIPLLYFFRGRRWRSGLPKIETRYVFAISGSYLALVGILTAQALRGQSIVQSDRDTMLALMVWLVGTSLAVSIRGRKASAFRPKTIGVLIP